MTSSVPDEPTTDIIILGAHRGAVLYRVEGEGREHAAFLP